MMSMSLYCRFDDSTICFCMYEIVRKVVIFFWGTSFLGTVLMTSGISLIGGKRTLPSPSVSLSLCVFSYVLRLHEVELILHRFAYFSPNQHHQSQFPVPHHHQSHLGPYFVCLVLFVVPKDS